MSKQIYQLTELTTVADGDELIINDITDSTEAKKITRANLLDGTIRTSVIDTDGTLSADSDAKIPSQKAVKAYSDNGVQVITNKTISTGSKIDENADQNITQYGMARQAIMNGNFDVWQRGTSVTPPDSATTYQADRWADSIAKDGGTLPTLTRSRQLQTSGDIANSFYFTRLATSGAGSGFGVNAGGLYVQYIENGNRNLCGLDKKVTVSFWARSSIANKRICVAMIQKYGTGGSPSADENILGTPITLTSTWTKYTATFTTNTLAGKTFGTAGDDSLLACFYYLWGTAYGNTRVQAGVTAETFVGAGNIDIAQVQLCSGDVALPFQPKSMEEELRACQRYYQVLYNGAFRQYVSNVYRLVVQNTVDMRKTPILSKSQTGTGLQSEQSSASSKFLYLDLAFTGGGAGVIDLANYSITADAEL